MTQANDLAVNFDARPLDQVDPQWAWQPFSAGIKAASNETTWGLPQAAHLLRRAGFLAPWSRLERAVAAGCNATVDALLAGDGDSRAFYAEAGSSVTALLGSNGSRDLPAWWLYVMLQTPHPLLEKMTLFWHGHFATSAAKVTDGRLMYQQNQLLRQYALGRFGPLLGAMAKDPAMLVWLDSTTNRKARPNENFAREVMELFALGLNNYTERDIKEAARAFSGWELRKGAFRENVQQHDDGMKKVLGQSGRWNGDDVIRILLYQPAASRFIVTKLFRFFVNEVVDPPPSLLLPLAEGFHQHDYDVSWLLRTIFRSNLFYSAHARGQKIKGPVELAVGLVRALEGSSNSYALVDDLAALGQSLFNPPTVKGWDGGSDWINTSTLVGRANLVWSLVGGGDSRYAGKIDLDRLGALAGVDSPAAVARRLVDLLITDSVPDEVLVRLTELAAQQPRHLAPIVQAIATLPEFQLG